MLDIFFLLLVIVIPLILGGLLAAAETSITALSLAKIHKLKSEGDKRANIIFELREDKEALISTILLASNAFNILASSLTTAIFIKIFGDDGVIYATVLMTVLIIIFAEIFPKTYAIAYPERVALSLAYYLKISVSIFRPITKAINSLVEYFMSFFTKTETLDKTKFSSKEEIKGTIELHHIQGFVDSHDKYMFDGIFYLREASVGRVMTHRKNMKCIDIDLSNQEILSKIKEIGHTRIPFWQGTSDNIIGVLNTKQLLFQMIESRNIDQIMFKDLLNKPVFVHENTPLDKQLNAFKKQKTKFAIVIDEYGDIEGIVTFSDILEEVVGQIYDEHTNDEDQIQFIDGAYVIQGKVNVRDINRLLHWNLPDAEAATIAGLVIHHLEKIPEEGEEFMIDNYKFSVIARDVNQITSIKVRKIQDEDFVDK